MPGIVTVRALAAVGLIAVASTVEAKCPPDSVEVGTLCVDAHEASVWIIPASERKLIRKVQRGKARAEHLTAGGAELVGCELVPDAQANWPANFPATGQWTPIVGSKPPSAGVYAASVAVVRGGTFLSGEAAGVFAIRRDFEPFFADAATGFRCAR